MASKRFFALLNKAPRIAKLWDEAEDVLNVDQFEHAIGVMSSGEIQMAKFFASLWFHDNTRYGFDLVDAVASLDEPERKLIIDWVNDPFYP